MMVSARKSGCLLQVVNMICQDTLFYFNCFNAVEQDDPSIGLTGGQLRIRGSLLRDQVFDPVVNQVSFHRSSYHSHCTYSANHRSSP